MSTLLVVAVVLILSDIFELRKQKRRVIAVYCTLFAMVLAGAGVYFYG